MTINCLVVDDQAMVREGFGAILNAQSDMSVVGQAADGAEAIALCREHHPDVILMDVRMPVMDGLEATRQILSEHGSERAVRVLILTTFDLDEYVYEALRSGASGFLLKDAPATELVHAVRVVAAGDALLAPSSPGASSPTSRDSDRARRALSKWRSSRRAKTRSSSS